MNKYGWAHTLCEIGDSTNWGENAYKSSDYGLTSSSAVVDDLATLLMSGRLSVANRNYLEQAYDETMAQGKGAYEAMINVQQLMVTTPEFQTSQVPVLTGEILLLTPSNGPRQESKIWLKSLLISSNRSF